ncbi:MAG: hypothetical protein JO309_10830 [Pseudonocardiales bacterium]|nr:hypothetical protein [Pseudonocardiales bacterium]
MNSLFQFLGAPPHVTVARRVPSTRCRCTSPPDELVAKPVAVAAHQSRDITEAFRM